MDKRQGAESVVPEVPAETPDAFDLAQSGMRVARKLVAANLLLREARDLLYHEEDVYGSFVHNWADARDRGEIPGAQSDGSGRTDG